MNDLKMEALSQKQVESIHLATLDVLNKTGIKVESQAALNLFADAGARIEKKDQYGIAKIPSQLVEDCLAWAPKDMVYHGRVAESDFIIAPDKYSFTTFGECVNIIDLDSQQFRKSTKKDCQDTALVCDYIEEMKVLERPLNPSDTPVLSQPLHNAEAIFANTTKHTFIGVGGASALKVMAKMAEICVGGKEEFAKRKIFTATVCPVSPLMLNNSCCETIIESAKLDIGLLIFSMPLAGATSTVTMGGTILTINAEILSAMVLAQLAKKGTSCTYGSAGTIMDLTLADVTLGAPEMALLSSASAQLARYYNLPSFICGGLSDSKLLDPQVGYEFSYSAMMCALAGGDIISGAGVMEQGLTFDYAKLLMDMEMSRSISQVVRGIDTSPQSMALEVIAEVGPVGEFLTHEHTYFNMQSHSKVVNFDRRKRDKWLKAGGKSLVEKSYDEARNILTNHKPPPLPHGVPDRLSDIVKEYEKELGI